MNPLSLDELHNAQHDAYDSENYPPEVHRNEKQPVCCPVENPLLSCHLINNCLGCALAQ
ncbi:MAG TPA: hypothetical protein VNM22_11440 [Candidatus Limnocylindrales bacterium]|nr:hypothetical protein [Candidatus Limnocylindrales bacterium]